MQGLSIPDNAWLAVQVRRGYEGMASASLREKGYEAFLPMRTRQNDWEHRYSKQVAPLFPGYLFCRYLKELRSPILTSPGVVRIVGAGNSLSIVEEQEIDSVRRLAESGMVGEPCPGDRVGRKVRLNSGPLCGVIGTILQVKDHNYVVVGVAALGRYVAITVSADWIITDLDG